jgi:BASS family bile acid:Na+ symporter
MFSDQSAAIQELLVGSFVIFMMLSVGIDLTVGKIKAVFRSPVVLSHALAVNYLVVPAIFYGLIQLTGLEGMWATGLLFVAVAPGGPVAGVLIQNAGGHLALGVSLLVLMNLLNTVLTPLGVMVLGAANSSDGTSLPLGGMMQTILYYQVIPLGVAMAFRHIWPHRATRLQPFIEKAAKVLLIVVAMAVVISEVPRLKTLPWTMVFVTHAAVLLSMAAGWFLTPGSREDKIAVAIASPYRSISVVLLLLAAWVQDMEAMLTAMTYSGAMLWMCLAASTWMKRRSLS